MYSTVGKMDDCEYSIYKFIVPLKERIGEANFFRNKHSIAGVNTQTMYVCKLSN